MKRKFLLYTGLLFISCFLFSKKEVSAQNSVLFWEISSKGLKKKSYLFGTIHSYNASLLKIPKEIFKAVKKADCFIGEIDLEAPGQSSISSQMHVAEGDKTLDMLLDEETLSKVLQCAPFDVLGREELLKLKPFWVMSYIMTNAESEFDMGSVDRELYDFAKQKGKPTTGLETIEEQLNTINTLSSEEQAAMLINYLENDESPQQSFNELTKAYKNQDFDKYREEVFKYDSTFSNELIKKRNLLMASRIQDFLGSSTKTAFIAVGALHLVNMQDIKGLVDLLRDKGYILTAKNLKL